MCCVVLQWWQQTTIQSDWIALLLLSLLLSLPLRLKKTESGEFQKQKLLQKEL